MLRYKEADEAEAAVKELNDGGQLLCVGLAAAGSAEGGDRKLIKKHITNPPAESGLELLVSNYPYTLPPHKLRDFLSGIDSAEIREMIVSGCKAYAFVKCENKDEIKLAVKTCHNQLLGGRRVKVQAKLPGLQASIIKELDREQSCSLNLEDGKVVRPFDLCTEESEEEDDLFSPATPDFGREESYIRPELDEIRNPSDTLHQELVLANFSEGTSELDIRNLFQDFKLIHVNLRVEKTTSSEPFTYAMLGFETNTDAEKAIDVFDGSNQLGSDNLILEYNQ